MPCAPPVTIITRSSSLPIAPPPASGRRDKTGNLQHTRFARCVKEPVWTPPESELCGVKTLWYTGENCSPPDTIVPTARLGHKERCHGRPTIRTAGERRPAHLRV